MCVVLVEDEPFIREIMTEALQDAGYEVVEAEDGPAALQLAHASSRRFTAVVTDFHMPGKIDGYQVAERFREAFPDIPVVIMSGRPEVFRPDWRTERGFHLLKKPFLPSDLIKTVRTILAGR